MEPKVIVLSTHRLSTVLGVFVPTVQTWVTRGLLIPSFPGKRGHGHVHCFSHNDIVNFLATPVGNRYIFDYYVYLRNVDQITAMSDEMTDQEFDKAYKDFRLHVLDCEKGFDVEDPASSFAHFQ